jgi:hypothetical protein
MLDFVLEILAGLLPRKVRRALYALVLLVIVAAVVVALTS